MVGYGVARIASAVQRKVAFSFVCIVLQKRCGVVKGVEASVDTCLKGSGVGRTKLGKVFKVDRHVHGCIRPVKLLKQPLLLRGKVSHTAMELQ